MYIYVDGYEILKIKKIIYIEVQNIVCFFQGSKDNKCFFDKTT